MDAKTIERREKGLYWDRAWKLVEGCTKVSPGCDNCWSESETVMRSNHPNEKIRTRALIVTATGDSDGEPVSQGCFTGSITMRHDNLNLPLTIKKPTVFAIWNDLYHKDVTAAFLKKAYQVMSDCPHHTFLVLTKRAERMSECCQGEFGRPENESHIYHGVTVCNQEEADRNVPLLSQVEGNTFLSIEPMLGPISLNRIYFNGVVDQVLLGGESGKNARPVHPNWVRTIRNQCEAAGVSFMFKQWGEWMPTLYERLNHLSISDWPKKAHKDEVAYTRIKGIEWPVERVGKKKAGRTLDGQIHAELIWDK